MELTPEERREVCNLSDRKNSGLPISPQTITRLKYLRLKSFHNSCSNPECLGYTGTDKETVCPECKSNLFKLI